MKQTVNPLIAELREEVKRNAVFKDIMHMLTLRKRTRGRLTVTRLKQAMEEEGFNYSRKQYESVLGFMGKLGLGTLSTSKRGKITALNGIKLRLQSIAEASLNVHSNLKTRQEQARYENLKPENARILHLENKSPIRESTNPVFLTMSLNGKLVNIPGPNNISDSSIGEFIANFSNLVKTYREAKV